MAHYAQKKKQSRNKTTNENMVFVSPQSRVIVMDRDDFDRTTQRPLRLWP